MPRKPCGLRIRRSGVQLVAIGLSNSRRDRPNAFFLSGASSHSRQTGRAEYIHAPRPKDQYATQGVRVLTRRTRRACRDQCFVSLDDRACGAHSPRQNAGKARVCAGCFYFGDFPRRGVGRRAYCTKAPQRKREIHLLRGRACCLGSRLRGFRRQGAVCPDQEPDGRDPSSKLSSAITST